MNMFSFFCVYAILFLFFVLFLCATVLLSRKSLWRPNWHQIHRNLSCLCLKSFSYNEILTNGFSFSTLPIIDTLILLLIFSKKVVFFFWLKNRNNLPHKTCCFLVVLSSIWTKGRAISSHNCLTRNEECNARYDAPPLSRESKNDCICKSMKRVMCNFWF